MRVPIPLLIALLLCAPARAEGPSAEPPAPEEPTPTPDEERGWIGIVFKAVDRGAYVKLVLPGMPAEEAGLRQGDTLLTVDGNSLADRDIKGIQVAMGGKPETTARVTLLRGKQELAFEIQRIHRPPDEEIKQLRFEAELAAMPPHARALARLKALGADADPVEVIGVWRAYLEENGEARLQETVFTSTLKALGRSGSEEAVSLLEAEVLPVVDEHFAEQPRVHRRIADFYLALDPPRHGPALARAELGLASAPVGNAEHTWLQRSRGEALLATGDVEGALAASAAALQGWDAPTLLWIGADGGEQDRLVVDAHSRLVILRAEALLAGGDRDGAAAVLRERLAYRYNEDTALLLQEIAGDEPAPPQPAFPVAAEPFPAFELPRLGGEGTVAREDLQGKPTLVALWASWCSPCRAELAHLAEAYPALADEGIEVLAVNVMDETAKAREAARLGAWPFPVVIDHRKRLTQELGVQSIPRAYVLDPAGNVVETYQGFSTAGAEEQDALLRKLASGERQTPHLVQLEVGDGQLALAAFHALPQARALAAADDGALMVATVQGQILPVTAGGIDEAGGRQCPTKVRDLELLPDGTCVATGKQHVTLLPPGGDPLRLQGEGRLSAAAVVGEQVVVARSGRGTLFAFRGDGTLAWDGGDEAVTWDLVPLAGADGTAQAGRLRPDGLEVLGADGATMGLRTLPDKISRAEAAGGEVILSTALKGMSRGDLDGDGRDETVVLLNTRQVLALSPERSLLFRFSLPVDGDIACADLDGDGRDELWVATAAAGVACFRYEPGGESGDKK